MPSHIFTRVGAWRESITANTASAQADAAAGWNTMHAYDYMVYAHLQTRPGSRWRKACSDRAKAMAKLADHFAAAYAYGAMPARLALERSDWAAAAKLPLTPAADAYPWAKYPQAEASNAYGARARRGGTARRARRWRRNSAACNGCAIAPPN